MVSSTLFSSASDEWETPDWLFDLANKEYHFNFDAAASSTNHKCVSFSHNSLDIAWGDSTWLNPPYSRIGEFIKKAYNESCTGKTVVCLIPSRTDTKWWHEFVMRSHEIIFIKGRLKFSGSKNSAPFPSCLVVFKKRNYTFDEIITRIHSIDRHSLSIF